MKQIYCTMCNKKHTAFNWKYTGTGWYCDKWFKPTNPEFVPERIKEDRVKHFKSTIQPWRNGEPSLEFQEAFPSRAKKYFKNEKKTPKYTWKDLPGWNSRQKSK